MFSYLKKWKNFLIFFVLILLSSFTLRFARVIFEKQPVFGDEAIYIRWSQVMRVEPSLRFVPQSDGKQPLFMWATIPFLKIFEDPLFAGRMLSVYTGIITTAGVIILTLLLFKSKKTALFAGILYAICPFSLFFDSLALADSMLSMFGVWTLVFAVTTIKKLRLDTAMLAGFSLGGALLTKSPASFFAILIPLTLIMYKWPKNLKIRNKDYVYPTSHLFTSLLDPLLPYLHRILEYLWIVGPGLIFLLFGVGVLVGMKKFKRETLLLLAWGIVPIFTVAEFSKTMTARYIYFSLPYLFIVSAISFIVLVENIAKRGYLYCYQFVLKKFLIIAFLIFITHSIYIDYQLIVKPQAASLPRSERSGYFEEWTAGYGINEVSQFLRTQYKNSPDQKIVVGTEGYFGTLPDGLQIYLNDIPEITIIGIGQPIKEIPEPLLESKTFGNKTYLVVNDSRMLFEVEEKKLRLINTYKKALRPDETRENLLFYEVEDD
jgi:4-amino-4-deoxy-L-arabinose transferase-like glycosyltransferase